MEPYKAEMLPFKFILDKETKKLVRDVYFKFGEYKYALKTLKYDYKHFLDIMLFTDALCTSNIEFEKLTLEDMFYFAYYKDTQKLNLIENIRKSFVYAFQYSKKNSEYTLEFFNRMNKILLKKTKSPAKEIGSLRNTPGYIMKLGLVGKNIDYIAPAPKDLKKLMNNFLKYLNESNDEALLKMAICHYQFLIIHPYAKANGRVARIMLPIEFNKLLGEEPILFMSEIFDKNKISYRRELNESKTNGPLNFIKFFLKCVIEMCDINISKIEKINKIYEEDFEYCKKEVGGTLINNVYGYIAKNVVFTVKKIVDDLHIHINSANKVLKRLVDANILIKEKKTGCNRVTYRYIKMFDIYTKKI